MKNKGFTLIEVILAITILSVIVGGLSYAFTVPFMGMESTEMKLLTYTYSQKEMERIINSPFNDNFNIPPSPSPTYPPYPYNNRFLYQITESPTGDSNLKDITIRFYDAYSTKLISEIYSTIRNHYINAPTIVANLNPTSITQGHSSTLSWTTTNATSLNISPGIGNIPAGEVASGSRTVSPSVTTTYTLTATGPGGTSSVNITLTVFPPGVPTISAILNPNPIYRGQFSTLSWTTTNATSLTILPGIGNIPAGEVASGSRTVSPSATTTYTLTATGPGGTTNIQVTLTVLEPPPPTISASLNPTTINPGQSSVLSWTTTNATSLTILPGIGNIPAGEVASGSRTVSPSSTTTYTLTATGPGGTTNTQVTLIVSLTENFDNDRSYNFPPFLWNNNPSGQWDVVLFGGSYTSRFSHGVQVGSSYPTTGWSSPTNNYLVEGRVYIYRPDTTTATSWAAIGGRCNTGGSGYYVRIDIEPSIVPVRTRITLRDNDTALLTTTYSGTLYFNQWVTLGLEMNGNSISYYFNGQLLGTVNDNNAYSSGRPFLKPFTGDKDRLIYFDDLRIVFRP